jgi:hypothetical protein
VVITAADRASSRGGRAGWFAKDLDQSRLDLFYCLLAVIGAVNLAFYTFVAARSSYNKTVKSAAKVGDIECAA